MQSSSQVHRHSRSQMVLLLFNALIGMAHAEDFVGTLTAGEGSTVQLLNFMNDQSYVLDGDVSIAAFPKGAPVKVTGSLNGGHVQVTAVSLLHGVVEEPQALRPSDGLRRSMLAGSNRRKLQPIVPISGKFTSLTLRLKLCGDEPEISHDTLQANILGGGRSLSSYYEQCSFGKVTLDASDNLVVSTPVPITKSCDGLSCSGGNILGDLNAVAEEAEQYAANQLNIDVSKYAVKILIFPQGAAKCRDVRMGYIGCFQSGYKCRTWLSAGDVQALAHETGHNLGLGHAGTKSNDDYGDTTCPMGSTGGFFCPNAYHSSKLGWTSPVDDLDINSLGAGEWTSVRLPPRAASSNNFLMLRSGSRGPMYVSYTAPVGWEAGNSGDSTFKLLVHEENSSNDQKTFLLARLSGGDSMSPPSYPGFVVRLSDDASAAGATVQVCRANDSGDCKNAPNASGAAMAVRTQPKAKAADNKSSSDTTAKATLSASGRKCPSAFRCGDDKCDAWAGENCQTCPEDCMKVSVSRKSFCCGGGKAGDGCDTECNDKGVGCRASCPANNRRRMFF